jgi:hypothetical protein
MGSSSKPSTSTDTLAKAGATEPLSSLLARSAMNDADVVHKALSLYEELRNASEVGRKPVSPKV